MTFDYELPAKLFTAKLKAVRGRGSAIVALQRRPRPSASSSKIFLRSVPLVRGCKSETRATTAKLSIACTRVAIIPYVAALAEDDSLLPAARTRTDGSVRSLRSHLPHSASRLAAGAIGFLIFNQSIYATRAVWRTKPFRHNSSQPEPTSVLE